ncbi:hypothetical protein VOLCADRAFT_96616 [Volvox carteri f. nagariensis]|uniref:Uncharacterized protein n=1 Tax=Volvox carteri f. nagariensis TaxID=3068 RepID=D8UAK7_VOLCA|nr:uncharacterized protein VOLCADRAFT_96616 [Volvox carteri f. nagariensis]EFJ43277.1 hypothetical protein VOLCADRAFT_96616 [Volvox carteri f. nagariensis]|eukprot:XP_002955637.1 hypothetical protein VOLCADRAFT_96616 [Volvox carteri f. nagariensis]
MKQIRHFRIVAKVVNPESVRWLAISGLAGNGPDKKPLPLPRVPTKGGTIAASASADGVAAACGGGSIHDPTTSVVSATTAPATSSASTAATAWSHDIILLASDRSRLGQFVQAELAPLLQQQQRQPQAATAAAPAQQAEPSSPRLRGVTHIRTACFDLGDLEGLETHIVRLLSPASTKPATDAGPAGNGNNGIGSEDMPVKHPSQAASWLATSTSTSVAADGGGGGGSEGAGLLPLPPSAYTHVLLVHNAGQVGDLVPLELQVLANIRRQTDLNVTSFAHLTAAVLRTFLYTPRLEPPPVPASADAATEASEPTSSQQPPGQQHSQQPQPPGQQQQQQDRQDHQSRQRRVITIVNISSVSVDQPYEHFSLYGMGKAARHMIVRSVAHEAALRETGGLVETAAAAAKGASAAAAAAAAAVGGAPLQWECSPGNTTGGGGGGGGGLQPAAVARVRALSYAPGAIDTEMQAAAREALPAGSLKSRFEDNARNGRLVDPRVSAQVLYDILAADAYDNGGHWFKKFSDMGELGTLTGKSCEHRSQQVDIMLVCMCGLPSVVLIVRALEDGMVQVQRDFCLRCAGLKQVPLRLYDS